VDDVEGEDEEEENEPSWHGIGMRE